jgi:hypothetical protein
MGSPTLFLDTNIYLGYALDARFEFFHLECSKVFHARRDRHTSETVRDELRQKQQDRLTLYGDLVKHLDSCKPPNQFVCSILKDSDQEHTTKVLNLFRDAKLSLEYLRMLGTELKEGILAGLKLTSKPLVKPGDNGSMMRHFETAIDIHYPDNMILTDFFEWAFPRDGSVFVTSDGGIHQNRGAILQHVRSCKGDCSHLSVQFIREIASKL